MSRLPYREIFWASKEVRAANPERIGLLQLAFPIILESILGSTVNLVDAAFVARISTNAVNAISVSSQYIMIFAVFADAMAAGTMVCINQAIGMQSFRKISMFSTIAVLMLTLLGIVTGILFCFFSPAMLTIMSLERATLDAAAGYMQLVGGLMIFQFLKLFYGQLIRSLGHTKAPLVINIVCNVINIVGNYLVIFRRDLFTIDPVLGVGATTLLSHFAAMLISALIAHRSGVRIGLKLLKHFPVDEFRLALTISIPNGISNILYFVSQLVTTAIIASTGDVYVSTKAFVGNLVGYMALIATAFSKSNAIMVGYRLGAGKYEEARKLGILVTLMGSAASFLCTLAVFFLSRQLIGIFTDDAFILSTAKFILLFDLAVEIGRAVNITIGGSLNAAGDIWFMMIVNFISSWLITVLGSYLLGVVLGWNLYGVWIALALDEGLRGLIAFIRWKNGKWLSGLKKRREVIAK